MTHTVIVVGGMGFIGHNLCHQLAMSGYRVIIVDNLTFGNFTSLTDRTMIEQARVWHLGGSIHGGSTPFFNSNKNIKYCRFSLYDVGIESSLMNGWFTSDKTTIVNLASFANSRSVSLDVQTAYESIVTNSMHMTRLAERYNAELIHISSSMVYGDWQDKKAHESHIPRPKCLYGTMKYTAELMVNRMYESNVTLRLSAVYGERDYNNRVAEKMAIAALLNHPIEVNGPENVLDLTYVSDVCDGIIQVIQCPTSGIYNMSAGEGITLLELAELIKGLTNSKSPIIVGPHEGEYPKRGAQDITKAASTFGFCPTVSPETGLTNMIAWINTELGRR